MKKDMLRVRQPPTGGGGSVEEEWHVTHLRYFVIIRGRGQGARGRLTSEEGAPLSSQRNSEI